MSEPNKENSENTPPVKVDDDHRLDLVVTLSLEDEEKKLWCYEEKKAERG